MRATTLLRVEGAAVGVAALAADALLDAPLWLLLALALAPDLSVVGYLRGPSVGAWTYNAAHVYAGPLLLGLLGVMGDVALAQYGAVVWTGHIGFDRALGYGLKEPGGFADTHLD